VKNCMRHPMFSHVGTMPACDKPFKICLIDTDRKKHDKLQGGPKNCAFIVSQQIVLQCVGWRKHKKLKPGLVNLYNV